MARRNLSIQPTLTERPGLPEVRVHLEILGTYQQEQVRVGAHAFSRHASRRAHGVLVLVLMWSAYQQHADTRAGSLPVLGSVRAGQLENCLRHALGEADEVDAMEAAIQFWHASLARFADASDEAELRSFIEHRVRGEVDRLIAAVHLPAYVAAWKMTMASLMVALPAVDRALTRNRVMVANARTRARLAQHVERRLDIGFSRRQ
jgi:hypothetical protein